jgi:CRISPR system Cascade subunit CasE
MMFFSRVRIEPGSLAQIELLRVLQGNVYAVHQLLWKLFPDCPDKKRDFLFRQEFEKEQLPYDETPRGIPIFYIVSKGKPTPVDGLLSVESKNYSPRLEKGMRLGFDVRLNPVVQEKVERNNIEEWRQNRIKMGFKEKDPTKRRIYHDVLMDAKRKAKEEGIDPRKPENRVEIKKRMEKAVCEWFRRKGEQSGFAIEEKRLPEVNAYRQNILRKRGQKEIRFSSIDLTGVLTVTDKNQFLETLEKGIGHARSFGCGLLLVKPV